MFCDKKEDERRGDGGVILLGPLDVMMGGLLWRGEYDEQMVRELCIIVILVEIKVDRKLFLDEEEDGLFVTILLGMMMRMSKRKE